MSFNVEAYCGVYLQAAKAFLTIKKELVNLPNSALVWEFMKFLVTKDPNYSKDESLMIVNIIDGYLKHLDPEKLRRALQEIRNNNHLSAPRAEEARREKADSLGGRSVSDKEFRANAIERLRQVRQTVMV
jgi:uncharacterized membrane protein